MMNLFISKFGKNDHRTYDDNIKNKNVSMNHYNGDLVRKQWHIGMKVFFKPKGFLKGKELYGTIIGHIYVNVLIISSGETEWFVSTFRCRPQ